MNDHYTSESLRRLLYVENNPQRNAAIFELADPDFQRTMLKQFKEGQETGDGLELDLERAFSTAHKEVRDEILEDPELFQRLDQQRLLRLPYWNAHIPILENYAADPEGAVHPMYWFDRFVSLTGAGQEKYQMSKLDFDDIMDIDLIHHLDPSVDITDLEDGIPRGWDSARRALMASASLTLFNNNRRSEVECRHYYIRTPSPDNNDYLNNCNTVGQFTYIASRAPPREPDGFMMSSVSFIVVPDSFRIYYLNCNNPEIGITIDTPIYEAIDKAAIHFTNS